MVRLFGREMSKVDVLAHVGDMDQLAGIRRVRFAEGAAGGMLAMFLRTGGGLALTILPDRGMDIANAEYEGKPLAWRSPTGDVSPAYYEQAGTGWLRSFAGGLVTTCGLANAGAPSTDAGEDLSMHGRIANIPAYDVASDAAWVGEAEAHNLLAGFPADTMPEGETYIMYASGKLREARVFGENLLLRRQILACLGESRIRIHDIVENRGWEPAPLMLLYHCNLGWPLLDRHARMLSSSREVLPRDEDAGVGLATYHTFDSPTPGYRERVYFHAMQPDSEGWVSTSLINNPLGLGLRLRYRQAELPYFTEWQMTGQGHYVVAFEPGTCLVMGRAQERAAGRLQFLQPGEQREFHLEFSVLTGNDLHAAGI